MILAEDRGNYHFIKFNALPEIRDLAAYAYSAVKYANQYNNLSADWYLFVIQNEIAACAARYGYWYESNPNSNFGKKWKNRYNIGNALIYALYEPLYYAMLQRFIYPNMSGNVNENWYSLDVFSKRLDARLYKNRKQSMTTPAKPYSMELTPSSGTFSVEQRGQSFIIFLKHLFNKRKEIGYRHDLAGQVILSVFEYKNVLKRIYDYLHVYAQMGQKTEGYEQFLLYAHNNEDFRQYPNSMKDFLRNGVVRQGLYSETELEAMKKQFDSLWSLWQKQPLINFRSADLQKRLDEQAAKNAKLVIQY